jgi:predicted nuclease with RNAse H fold
MWAGIDVGGERKGFHVAVLQGWSVELLQLHSPEEVARWLRKRRPHVIAIDSPRRAAPDGMCSRDCERALARSVCGIRWTPDERRLRDNPYYEWIRNGFRLYRALDDEADVVEVFPTAAWTRWAGPRHKDSRAAWSRRALAGLPVEDVPAQTNQDVRDAIAAALTARLHSERRTEMFGDIAVPST